MDDKTMIAKYVAEETVRIKDRMKRLASSPTPPTEEEKNDVLADMEATLARLKSALTQITPEMLEDSSEMEKKRKPS